MCSTYSETTNSYDIENIVRDKTLTIFNKKYTTNNLKIKYFTLDLVEKEYNSQQDFDKMFIRLRRKYGIIPKKSEISCYYYNMIHNKEIQKNESLEFYLITKKNNIQEK
jgi:hypothetical protein